MVDSEGLIPSKAQEWRETQLGTYPKIDENLEEIPEEKI